MNVVWQLRILCAVVLVCAAGAAYNLTEIVNWQRNGVETRGTITEIEGTSADAERGRRGAALQTIHYRYTVSEGNSHVGIDKIWWGDRRHRRGGTFIVYYYRDDPKISETRTGLDDRLTWTFMLSFVGLVCVAIIWFCKPMWRGIVGGHRGVPAPMKR